jgi:hypothetical protein
MDLILVISGLLRRPEEKIAYEERFFRSGIETGVSKVGLSG